MRENHCHPLHSSHSHEERKLFAQHFKINCENEWLIITIISFMRFSDCLCVLRCFDLIRCSSATKLTVCSVIRQPIGKFSRKCAHYSNLVLSPIWTNYMKELRIRDYFFIHSFIQCANIAVASKSIKPNEHKLMWKIQKGNGRQNGMRKWRRETETVSMREREILRDVSKPFNGFSAKWNHPLSHHFQHWLRE